MTKTWQLLDNAYSLINQNRNAKAAAVLSEVLKKEPQNLQAWEAYLGICNTRSELEQLKSQVLTLWNSQVRDEDFLLANQQYILRRVEEKLMSV